MHPERPKARLGFAPRASRSKAERSAVELPGHDSVVCSDPVAVGAHHLALFHFALHRAKRHVVLTTAREIELFPPANMIEVHRTGRKTILAIRTRHTLESIQFGIDPLTTTKASNARALFSRCRLQPLLVVGTLTIAAVRLKTGAFLIEGRGTSSPLAPTTHLCHAPSVAAALVPVQ